MPKPKTSQETIDQMVDLWRDRNSTTAIAKKLNLSYTTVYFYLRQRYLVG